MATNRIETLDPALIRPGKLVYCTVLYIVAPVELVQSVCCIVIVTDIRGCRGSPHS